MSNTPASEQRVLYGARKYGNNTLEQRVMGTINENAKRNNDSVDGKRSTANPWQWDEDGGPATRILSMTRTRGVTTPYHLRPSLENYLLSGCGVENNFNSMESYLQQHEFTYVQQYNIA